MRVHTPVGRPLGGALLSAGLIYLFLTPIPGIGPALPRLTPGRVHVINRRIRDIGVLVKPLIPAKRVPPHESSARLVVVPRAVVVPPAVHLGVPLPTRVEVGLPD